MRAWVFVAACGVAAATYEYDLVQGDIQVEVERLADGTRRRMGSALGSTPLGGHDRLWDLGRVNYYIETVEKGAGAGSPLLETEPRIQAAVTEWESKTCIRLTRCNTEAGCTKPYIRFKSAADSTCNSPVGVAFSEVNQINLGIKCGAGTIVHEIAHSLGLSHEQSRKDRNEYVTIDTAEIKDGMSHNFAQNVDPARDIGPYDYSSIMHYSATAFAKASKPTIISPQPIGARAGLSAGDVAAIDFMYHGCKAAFAAPTCVASVDVSAAHVIPHTHAWTVDFNALYAESKTMTVTYPLTTAPAARVEYTTASGNSLGNAGFARVKFTPSAADGGNTFKLSATFTGSDGPAVTCSVEVVVASADKVCFGLASNDPKVCSGRGVCGTNPLAPCTCESGYGGLDCSGFATCPTNYQWSFDIDEGTWSPFGGAGATADYFAAGGGSLKIGDEADTGSRPSAGVTLVDLSKPARVTFYLAWMGGAHSGPSMSFQRKVDDMTTHFCWSVWVHQPSGQFVAGSSLTGKTVETNRFYFIDLRFDWAASTVDLYVDGSLLTADSPFGDACNDGMERVAAFGNGWVDEVNLWCSNYVTLTGSPSQAQLRAGGATLTLTLVGDHDTWVDTEANRQAVVDALVANVALPTGWNALRATMLDASLVTINGQVLTLGPLRPAPTFSVQYPQTVTMALTGSMFTSGVPPASAAHELQFTVSGEGCNRGMHVGYDDPATAIKKAGAGSRELATAVGTSVQLHATDLSKPESFSVYVRTTNVNSALWILIASAADERLSVRHSRSGNLAVKAGNVPYTTLTPTAINVFQKITVTFNWADGTFVLSFEDSAVHTGTLPFTSVKQVYFKPDLGPVYVDEVTFTCPRRLPLYALNTVGCVNGASAVTVLVTEGSETLSATDKIAIVPGTSTDCTAAETQCGALNGCSTSTGSLTKVLSEVHWAAGTLATLPADASYKVCYFLASRGNYELLDNTFTTCAAAVTPPTYAVTPAPCVPGDETVTVQVTKGTKTLSTADKIAIVPNTATDCAQAATQCAALNGCSEAANLMLAGENLVWTAGNLATLAKDTQFKVCHQLNGGAYELLAGTFRTCVDLPTFAVNPAACLDGEAAVTVEITKGTDRLSTADDIALVLDSSTDCGGAEMQCIILGGCSSTVGGLVVMGDDLHWIAGPLPMLPAGSSFKLCYYSAVRRTFSLLDGTITTCAAPPTLPPVPTPVGCLNHVPPPYYVSLPSNTCVNDGQHASQGSEQVLQYGTKAECCNGLTPKERRECLKPEVVSEVYPDFEKGRCVSDTLRPAVVHPACGVTAAGANKFVAGRFLKASLLVSDRELSCKRVYGGIGEAAVARCVARQGTWYYVDGMGLVQDDPLVDDPVVYATARTVGSLSACTQTYFPRVPAVMCDTFTCTAPWTNKADRGSIHCGAASDDCTKELCCTAPAAPPVTTCCGYRCLPTAASFLSAKTNPELIVCPPEGCLPSHCCDYDAGEILAPSSTPLAHRPAVADASGWTYWMIQCGDGQVPDLSIDLVHFGGVMGTEFIGRQVDTSGVETQSFRLSGGSSTGHTHLAVTRVMTFAFFHETGEADGVTMRYQCVDKP